MMEEVERSLSVGLLKLWKEVSDIKISVDFFV